MHAKIGIIKSWIEATATLCCEYARYVCLVDIIDIYTLTCSMSLSYKVDICGMHMMMMRVKESGNRLKLIHGIDERQRILFRIGHDYAQ